MTGAEDSGLFAYPRGWFMVARSDELGTGEPVDLRFFGRKFAAFRGSAGQAIVLDATCPHMGANLAVGGRIDGDGLRCPFHAWRFGPDGRCNDIPYTKMIPARAQVRAYPVREINGNIFLWHDPEAGEPDYELPDLAEYRNPQCIPWSMVRKDILTVPHEIVDNIADRQHFPVVHGAGIASFRNEFIGPRAYQYAMNEHATLAAEPGGDLPSEACYHGPGYLLTYLGGHMPSWMLICHTPLDHERVAVWYGLTVKGTGPIDAAFVKAAADYTELGKIAFYQDVRIWENKDPAPRPLLVSGDGPILEARAWYRQFFLPRDRGTQAAAAE